MLPTVLVAAVKAVGGGHISPREEAGGVHLIVAVTGWVDQLGTP